MSWMMVAAIIAAFLLGGVVVAEYLVRRIDGRRGMPWVDEHSPTPAETKRLRSD